MRLATASLFLVAAIVAACSGTPSPTSAPTDAPTNVPSAATTTQPSVTTSIRIEVQVTDGLRIEPAELRVPAGVPITFVVTNIGALLHEFYLGDADAQDEHEKEMAGMPGMTHDEPEGIGLAPGETKELTFTFEERGTTLAGCHVQGHDLAGMRSVITVE